MFHLPIFDGFHAITKVLKLKLIHYRFALVGQFPIGR